MRTRKITASSMREPRTKAEQLAARDLAIELMTELLTESPRTVSDLVDQVGGLRPTISNYLQHMRRNLRTAMVVSEPGIKPALWGLGVDPALAEVDARIDDAFAERRGIAPAKQVGMWRCPMVAAIFGPAKNNQQEVV